MTDIVVNYDDSKGMFQIYESSSNTLIISQSLGEGFSNLNGFLLTSGTVKKSILEDNDIQYHFDAHTFQEIIKSNMSLIKRVSEIPSEFKNSVSRFGGAQLAGGSSGNNNNNFARGSRNFQKGRMEGYKSSSFGKSFSKFRNAKKS